jgi:hypothetical protein
MAGPYDNSIDFIILVADILWHTVKCGTPPRQKIEDSI